SSDPVRLCHAYQRATAHDLFADPGAVEPDLAVCELENERPGALQAWAGALFDAIGDWDYRQAARKVRAPALVVQGQSDRITPPSGAETWAGLLPDAKLLRLPATGYIPLRERPQRTAEAVERFLSEGDPR
ncbi:MAG: alpha/beta hydrolase, partial [Thermoanaerobaculia bacterium]|nr:alpha/beta hydrolase [Thermoanaerobaculia bacterium]